MRGCFKLSGHRFIGWQFQRIGNVLGCRKIGKKQELWGLSWLQENLSDWRVSRMEAVAGCITWSTISLGSDLDSGSYLSKYATMQYASSTYCQENDLGPSPKCAQRPQTHGGRLRSPEMNVRLLLGFQILNYGSFSHHWSLKDHHCCACNKKELSENSGSAEKSGWRCSHLGAVGHHGLRFCVVSGDSYLGTLNGIFEDDIVRKPFEH